MVVVLLKHDGTNVCVVVVVHSFDSSSTYDNKSHTNNSDVTFVVLQTSYTADIFIIPESHSEHTKLTRTLDVFHHGLDASLLRLLAVFSFYFLVCLVIRINVCPVLVSTRLNLHYYCPWRY
jgi:hypothetical protein